MAQALLGQRPGPALLGAERRGGFGGLGGRVGRGPQAAGQAVAVVDCPVENVGEGKQGVHHRLVAGFGLAEGDDGVAEGVDGGGRVRRGVGVLAAQGPADGGDRGAPERAGGAAGAFGPLFAGGGEDFLESGAGRVRLFGRGDGGVDAAAHADAVVAVAGDRVEFAEGFLVFDDDRLGHLQHADRGGGQRGRRRRGSQRGRCCGVGLRGEGPGPARSQVALAEGGGVGRCGPELFQLRVQPEQRQRTVRTCPGW